jgi:TolA-binding protein
VVEPSPSAEPAAALAAPPPGPGATDVRSYAASASDLRDQIALIDAARSALASSSDRRALEILRRYQDKYPSGSFRPEAAALRVEVLVKLGRDAEARALAERFVAEYRGSLLARRVAELTGVGRP